MQTLLDFSAGLSSAYGLDAVFSATAANIARALDVPSTILVADGERLKVAASSSGTQPLRPTDLQAAQFAADMRRRTGATTEIEAESTVMFVPMISGQRLMAVLGLQTSTLDGDRSDVLASMIEQAAIAIDRAQWIRESAETNLLRESERLQSALLSSLSHDFRTPLASITGAASSVRQLGERMDEATRDDLLRSIEEDAARLTRFVATLLAMTRLEAGRLAARRARVGLPEILERSIERVHAISPSMEVTTSFSTDLRDIEGDAVLLEQVLFNLLDNARKYAGSGGAVKVFARSDADWTEVSLTDDGDGIPAADLEVIFQKFYRGGGADGRGPGTGLGLAIARGFVSAMGGTIRAESPAFRKRGTRFIVKLRSAPSTTQ
jgi:two-component system sensor histidine kinase KdpD